MAFKYDSEITSLKCNLERFTERTNRNAFCWAFDPINDNRNFVPRAIVTGKNECGSWALSFYETKDQAKNRLKTLLIKTPLLYQKLGTHIAHGLLNPDGGISESCNSVGHFNHHEYAGNDFSKTFTTVDLSYI